MESEGDEHQLDLEPKSIEGIYSFPYQLDTPKLDPYLVHQYGDEAMQMPQSVKYLHEIYPPN